MASCYDSLNAMRDWGTKHDTMPQLLWRVAYVDCLIATTKAKLMLQKHRSVIRRLEATGS